MDEADSFRDKAAEALRMARRHPVGPERNELRQIALCLLWLDRKGFRTRKKLLETAFRLRAQADQEPDHR